MRRGRRLKPPPPSEPNVRLDQPRRKPSTHDRRGAALKAWQTRFGRRRQDYAWMMQKVDE